MTGLTPPEHEHSAALDLAFDWLKRGESPSTRFNYPLISELRFRFDLTMDQACAVAAEAYSRRGRPWTS